MICKCERAVKFVTRAATAARLFRIRKREGSMAERRLKHFGWGREGEGLTAEEEVAALDRYRRLFTVDRFDERSPPALSEIALRLPRIAPPPALAPHCSSEPYDRVA